MAEKNPHIVAVSRHSGDSYLLVFCDNGDVYRLQVDPMNGTIMSEKVHEIFHDVAVPQAREGMKPYWNDSVTPRPGLAIREVRLEKDNVYILDQTGRVWQVVIDFDQPEIRLVANEGN